jgi:hypothetical protein
MDGHICHLIASESTSSLPEGEPFSVFHPNGQEGLLVCELE